MTVFKVILGLILFGALVAMVQLTEPTLDSPAALFQRLPDVAPATGAEPVAGNSFDNLASGTVADSVLFGDIAEQARQGKLDKPADEFSAALDSLPPTSSV